MSGENPKKDNIEQQLEKILCEHGILGWELKMITPYQKPLQAELTGGTTQVFYITFEREIKIDFEEE